MPSPKADNPQECGSIADMMIVAHALAKHDVDSGKAKELMQEIYAGLLTGPASGKWEQLMDGVMRFAAMPSMRELKSLDIARSLLQYCQARQGNIEELVGQGV